LRVVLLPLALLGVVALVGLASDDATPRPRVEPDVKLVEIGRFDQPIHVTSPLRDGRVFVVEKTGRIWVLTRGRRLRQPFLDLSRRVLTGTEQGLLSLAFAPDYAATGRLYVSFTDRRNRLVVEEFRRSSDPNRAEPGTGRTVLVVPHRTERHYGGHVLFGPDGLLYVSKGDGGSAPLFGDFAPQELDDLNGKILRVDPRPARGRRYGIPEDNPLVGRRGRDEIWAYGLRNPWRLAFDPATGGLLIGDVGLNRVEEIDLASRGGLNFGWSCFEGTQPYAANGPPSCATSVHPILERFRIHPPEPRGEPRITRGRGSSPVRLAPGENVCSIVVGPVVRDPGLPSLRGRVLHGDFCEPSLRSFRLEGGIAVDDRALGLDVFGLSSFGADAAGRVYVTSLGGPVYRLAAR